jgi:hypothetical protein
MRMLERAAGFAYALVAANYDQLAEIGLFVRAPRATDVPLGGAAAPVGEGSHDESTRVDDCRRQRRGARRIPRA